MKKLSDRFLLFAERECVGSSELYEYLSIQISKDQELLELAGHSTPGQPVPNLFLGAIHFLLQKKPQHELAQYYPSLSSRPKSYHDVFPAFKNFCQVHRDEIIGIIQTKIVQTNEVRRSAYLYPVFSQIYNETSKPLALIEIGTSAGLQLLWDQYCYSYGSDKLYGFQHSDLHIKTEVRGSIIPFLLKQSPPVSHRFGLDLHINDLSNQEDSLWLQSLIWPEHHERRELFQSATKILTERKDSIHLLEGDGVALLPKVTQKIPKESIICVFHTHVANQFPNELKNKLLEQIRKIGHDRDIFHIYNNIQDRFLHMDAILNQVERNQTIAETDGHGRWFKWLL